MKPALLLPLLAILAAPASPVAAQAAADTRHQAAVFTIQDLSAAGATQDQSPAADTRDYQDTITESVSAAFRADGYDVVEPGRWQQEAQRRSLQPRALLEESSAMEVARAAGADIAVTGYYAVQGESIYVSLQCWDVATGVLAVGLQQATQFNIGFYGTLFGQVTAMLARIPAPEAPSAGGVAAVGASATVGGSASGGGSNESGGAASASGTAPASATGTPGIASRPAVPVLDTVTFVSSDEGAELFLAGGARIGEVTDGHVVWQGAGVVPGSRFTVEKRKGGFHTGVETVRAAREIRLRGLVAQKALALEVDWTFGQLAGMGATLRVYPSPDAWFLFLGNYFYAQPPLTSAGYTVFHDDAGVGAGSYIIFPADSWVRVGVSTGVGAILTATTGPVGAFYKDFYWDLFNWWIETRVLGPVIFLRQEVKFTLGTGLLGMQPMTVANFPPFTLGVVFRW
ncbi:MAG TPA: hypothetical protein VMF68_02540 [Spirochaetia bacterium]|nr:hypothetical protein [Spirochaetia bacterium]